MKHWSVDEERMQRLYPERYRRWRIEQRVNLGVGTWKLDRAELKQLWDELDLDEDRKRTLEWFLWPNRRARS